MNKIIIMGLLIISALFIISCTNQQIVGGDKDEHGCIGSAGYSWCDAKQKCLRTWEENCTTQDTSKHICTEQESIATACTLEYAPVCGEIVLNMGKTIYQTFGNGCSACAAMKVVSYTQGECPPDKTTDMCVDQQGNYLTLPEAVDIAKSSACGNNLVIQACSCPQGYSKEGDSCNPACYSTTPPCLAPSVQCEKTYFCNEGTGTFWIQLNLTKQGCNPACVINVANKTAEINWRCTGLAEP